MSKVLSPCIIIDLVSLLLLSAVMLTPELYLLNRKINNQLSKVFFCYTVVISLGKVGCLHVMYILWL